MAVVPDAAVCLYFRGKYYVCNSSMDGGQGSLSLDTTNLRCPAKLKIGFLTFLRLILIRC
jgi:hypothetical protein